jgi:NTP pyrophosphatase (non-canonical NTP hydrolase)
METKITVKDAGGKVIGEWRRDAEGNLIELTFPALAAVNIQRCRRWHDPDGWNPQMWGLAAAGEMGECCNALKKLWRHDNGIQQNAESPDREKLLQAVATEIGDTVVYLDLLAQRLGLRLEDCVRDTFNRISVRENFPERL